MSPAERPRRSGRAPLRPTASAPHDPTAPPAILPSLLSITLSLVVDRKAGAGHSSEGVVGGALSGLEPAEEYTYELLAKSSHGEADMEGGFVTLPVAPLVLASGATEVLAYGASMNGTVDPQDSTVFTGRTFYRFQYGPCRGECAGSPYPYEAPEVSAGSGHQAVAVSEALKELEPEAAYHYRVVAIGPGGEALSGEQVFTTAAAPAGVQALTGPASSVTQSTATLNGTVDPGGQATTYAWEVGTSTSYGTTVYGSLLAESEPVAVSLALSELRAGTTYHYRLVSTSRSDTSYRSLSSRLRHLVVEFSEQPPRSWAC